MIQTLHTVCESERVPVKHGPRPAPPTTFVSMWRPRRKIERNPRWSYIWHVQMQQWAWRPTDRPTDGSDRPTGARFQWIDYRKVSKEYMAQPKLIYQAVRAKQASKQATAPHTGPQEVHKTYGIGKEDPIRIDEWWDGMEWNESDDDCMQAIGQLGKQTMKEPFKAATGKEECRIIQHSRGGPGQPCSDRGRKYNYCEWVVASVGFVRLDVLRLYLLLNHAHCHCHGHGHCQPVWTVYSTGTASPPPLWIPLCLWKNGYLYLHMWLGHQFIYLEGDMTTDF